VGTRGVELDLVYQDALFSAARMHDLLQQYHGLLTQIAAASEQPILSYSLITPTAQAWLPDPSAVIEAPAQQPVTQLFATWAERQPDAIAVTQGVRQWSYRALANAANRLARSLRRCGIGRGDVVAIIGTRSFGLVSSMLGVSISGGVFLTVDSTLPAARQRTMLREARAKAICRIGAVPVPTIARRHRNRFGCSTSIRTGAWWHRARWHRPRTPPRCHRSTARMRRTSSSPPAAPGAERGSGLS